MTSGESLIRLQGITKEYHMGAEIVRALRGVDLAIHAERDVGNHGFVGVGKVDHPQYSGFVGRADGGPVLAGRTRRGKVVAVSLDARVRGRRIGFVFQTFELLPRQTGDPQRRIAADLLGDGTSAPAGDRSAAARGSRGPDEASSESDVRWTTPARGDCSRTGPASRPFCWQMSQRAIWTVTPARRSWTCSKTCTARDKRS